MDRRPVLIFAHCAVNRDAIGNDVLIQSEMLRAAGYDVSIYANHHDEFFAQKVCRYGEAQEILRQPDSILIYHHSCFTPNIERFFAETQGQILVKYHNITPAEYFPHSKAIQRELALAHQQSRYMVRSGKVSLFVGDSHFNNQDFLALGASPDQCRVLAPFHLVEDFARAGIDQDLKTILTDGAMHVMFVSRIMKHKGQVELVDVVDHYMGMYDREICLHIIGKIENPFYGQELEQAINSRRLSNHVKVHQNVDFKKLHTFYRHCQAFVMLSEHEGFGVPILEAQFNGLPILALDRAAVRETIGPDQLVFKDKDPAIFAAGIRRLRTDAGLGEFVRARGLENYGRFKREVLKEQLVEVVRGLSNNQ